MAKRKQNRGRCSRCGASELRDLYKDGAMHRWCVRYSSICQKVARNCDAPSTGFTRRAQPTNNETRG